VKNGVAISSAKQPLVARLKTNRLTDEVAMHSIAFSLITFLTIIAHTITGSKSFIASDREANSR
jgi:hypothetical protein